MKTLLSKSIKQFTPVYHIEYGKGHVVSSTTRFKDTLHMVFFPKLKLNEWALDSKLRNGTDPYMSLQPISQDAPPDRLSDPLQQALENLFGGGR